MSSYPPVGLLHVQLSTFACSASGEQQRPLWIESVASPHVSWIIGRGLSQCRPSTSKVPTTRSTIVDHPEIHLAPSSSTHRDAPDSLRVDHCLSLTTSITNKWSLNLKTALIHKTQPLISIIFQPHPSSFIITVDTCCCSPTSESFE
jgi:hypothetical protein